MKKLLEKNLPELIRYATGMSGNRHDAEDLVHNAIEKIIKSYPGIADNTEFLKISYKVIRNLFIDIKRKKIKINVDRYSDEDIGNIQYKTTLNLDETIRIKTISTEDKMIEKEIKLSRKRQYEIARLCLSILDHETQKTVLTLFSDGLKYNEIAERLDIPKGTVMSSLARARIKVAECIKKRLKNEQ